MKNIKHILLTALFAFTATICTAQRIQKDSISIDINDKADIKVSIYDYSELKETIGSDLKQLQEILNLENAIPENLPYTILYKPKEKLTIKNKDETESVIWENGKYKEHKYRNTCEIVSEKYHMLIDFNDLEHLTSEDLISKLNEVIDATTENQNRFSTLFNYSFDKDDMFESDSYTIASSGDMLYLQAGVGANLIKNELVVDLTGVIGLGFSKKGIVKNQYYLSYNMLYDFIDNSSPNINGFLNLGYRHNFSNNKDEDNWLGLEFGYMINQDGDLFDDNTFRFGFSWEAANMITISPQLYISSEQTFPGLRIGFGF